MIKVTALGNKSKTIPVMRYILRNSKELNEFRISLYFDKEIRMHNLDRKFGITIKNNTNNHRKIMHTYFEPYD
jgi:hypothetical protein